MRQQLIYYLFQTEMRAVCVQGREKQYSGKNSTGLSYFFFLPDVGFSLLPQIGTVHTQYCKISTLSTTLPSEIGDFQIIFLRQHLEPSKGRVPINPVSKENSTKSWYQICKSVVNSLILLESNSPGQLNCFKYIFYIGKIKWRSVN